jgi:hypothetical protein
VVGDADQSIYSWRGAHVGSLSDFADEFEGYLGVGVHTSYLMENYRSTSNIVNAAQKVISASSGKSSTGADKLRQNMKPKRGAGATPRIIACKDEKAEGRQLVRLGRLVSSLFRFSRLFVFLFSRLCRQACERLGIIGYVRAGQLCCVYLPDKCTIACSGGSMRVAQPTLRYFWLGDKLLQTARDQRLPQLSTMDVQWA